jgi:ATP-dependent DNA ligase
LGRTPYGLARAANTKASALDGGQPLEERKGRLQPLLREVAAPGIQFNEHIEEDGAAVFQHACKLGFEGIVSKRRDHPCRSGPSKAWIKVKNPTVPGVLRFADRT